MEGYFGHGVWFSEGSRDRLNEAIAKLSEGLRVVKYTQGIDLDEEKVYTAWAMTEEITTWVEHNLPFSGTTFLPIKQGRELRSFVNRLEREAAKFADLVCSIDDDDEDPYLTNLKKEAIQHFRLAEGYFCQLY